MQATAFARRVFLGAGIYGLASLMPLYFLADQLALTFPPTPAHPENFYGFFGVALAWQFAFFVIASDVERYRRLMLPAMAEKFIYSLTLLVLHLCDMVTSIALTVAAVELGIGLLFVMAFLGSGRQKRTLFL